MQIRKRFKVKKIIGMFLTFILMIGVCGCHMENEEQKEKKKQSRNDKIWEMKQYLCDKYGYIDYDVVAFRGKSTWGEPHDLLVLTTDYEGKDVNFCVIGFEQDGEYVYADSYVQFLTADELEEDMKEFTSNYFSEFRVYANVGGETEVFPMSFKTYDDIKDRYDEIPDIIPRNSHLTFSVCVKESSLSGEEEFNTIKEKYYEDVDKLGYVSCCYLYYVDDDDECFDEK